MLSDISKEILRVLRDDSGLISTDEIVRRLPPSDYVVFNKSVVELYLRDTLREYVGKVGENWWVLNTIPAELDQDLNGSPDRTKTAELTPQDQHILRHLFRSEAPLTAAEIAEKISNTYRSVTTRSISQRLHGDLKDYVVQNENFRWSIDPSSRDGVISSLEESEIPKEAESDVSCEGEIRDPKVILANVVSVFSSKDECLTTQTIKFKLSKKGRSYETEELLQALCGDKNDSLYFMPERGWTLSPASEEEHNASLSEDEERYFLRHYGHSRAETSAIHLEDDDYAKGVISLLDTATKVVVILSIVQRPLQPSGLLSIAERLGLNVSEADLRVCLDQILGDFVKVDEEEYELDRVDENTLAPSGADSVDQETRASLSGRLYNYEFTDMTLNSAALFASEIRGGTMYIRLNSDHPSFGEIRGVISSDASSVPAQALRTFLAGWATMESDLPDTRQHVAEDMREEWGRAVRSLLRERESTE
jgi:hypothetical protein